MMVDSNHLSSRPPEMNDELAAHIRTWHTNLYEEVGGAHLANHRLNPNVPLPFDQFAALPNLDTLSQPLIQGYVHDMIYSQLSQYGHPDAYGGRLEIEVMAELLGRQLHVVQRTAYSSNALDTRNGGFRVVRVVGDPTSPLVSHIYRDFRAHHYEHYDAMIPINSPTAGNGNVFISICFGDDIYIVRCRIVFCFLFFALISQVVMLFFTLWYCIL